MDRRCLCHEMQRLAEFSSCHPPIPLKQDPTHRENKQSNVHKVYPQLVGKHARVVLERACNRGPCQVARARVGNDCCWETGARARNSREVVARKRVGVVEREHDKARLQDPLCKAERWYSELGRQGQSFALVSCSISS